MEDKHQISERLDRFINLYGETWAKVFTFVLAGAVGTAFAALLIIPLSWQLSISSQRTTRRREIQAASSHRYALAAWVFKFA